MTMPKFTPFFLLIALLLIPNATLAAGNVEAAASVPSAQKQARAVSVAVSDMEKVVEVSGQPWRIRRTKNPMGSFVLFRNETAVPLLVSFADDGGFAPASEPLPAGATRAQRCEIGRASYPLAVASERGEGVLNAQLKCGDSVVVQSPERPNTRSLEAINAAWAPPPSESAETPRSTAREH